VRKFGLIGRPLTHSFSKKYFEEKFQREKITDCCYDLFELKSIEALPILLKSNTDLVGLNVTIPYKESAIKYVEWISDEAKAIGAVNCLRWNSGKLEGYNTDCFGFELAFKKFFGQATNKSKADVGVTTNIIEQTFVLGTGGSSKAIQYVLKKFNISFQLVSRVKKEKCISYSEISGAMKNENLFINTTPVGMFPSINDTPDIPYEKITEKDFLFDLIYNPVETEFLKRGKSRGAKTKNGFEMLQLQAEKSWEIWNR